MSPWRPDEWDPDDNDKLSYSLLRVNREPDTGLSILQVLSHILRVISALLALFYR